MSEKVILTKEQAESIGFAKKHHMRHEILLRKQKTITIRNMD